MRSLLTGSVATIFNFGISLLFSADLTPSPWSVSLVRSDCPGVPARLSDGLTNILPLPLPGGMKAGLDGFPFNDGLICGFAVD